MNTQEIKYTLNVILCVLLCCEYGNSAPNNLMKLDEQQDANLLVKIEDHLDSLSVSMRELIGVVRNIKVNVGSNITPSSILNGTLVDEQKRSIELLLQILKHVSSEKIDCRAPFEQVGESCMHLYFSEKMSWHKGRAYCNSMDSDLAKFTDEAMYGAAIKYVWKINSLNKAISVWTGGNDIDKEGIWLWTDGTAMPHGAPFWGSSDKYKKEPGEGTGSNCAFMFHADSYYLHDTACDYKDSESSPLCQYFPEF